MIIQAVVSYRSIPRILNLFNSQTPLGISWIPHFTSVINWTLRFGLGRLKQVKPISVPWLAIIDHSIDIGTKKVLVVLRVTMDALSKKQGAIQLEDCECIGLSVREVVNGESTAKDLDAVFRHAGIPDAVIKDCDATLNKGVRLCSQMNNIDIPVIEDIGHVMATALKHQFEGKSRYKEFIAKTSQGASYLRQTDLAFLIPPKLRSKGRFQSIGKLAKWGSKMLDVFAVKGRAEKGSVLERLRKTFPGFNTLKPFIKNFACTAKITADVMEILKNQGLNKASHDRCQQLAQELPVRSKVKKRLLKWLKDHLKIQQEITNLPLLVSSDILESLFGNFKHVMQRSPQADMNRTTLLIPALCGNREADTVIQAFKLASQKDLIAWEKKEIPYTLQKKRQAFFTKNKIQKPGIFIC